MRNMIICPRTKEPCCQETCLIANEPLEDAITNLAGDETTRGDAAQKALEDELREEARRFGTDFKPSFGPNGSGTICISGVTMEGIAPKDIARGLAEAVRGCIETAGSELLVEDQSDHRSLRDAANRFCDL